LIIYQQDYKSATINQNPSCIHVSYQFPKETTSHHQLFITDADLEAIIMLTTGPPIETPAMYRMDDPTKIIQVYV
jgi:hypothetical protein